MVIVGVVGLFCACADSNSSEPSKLQVPISVNENADSIENLALAQVPVQEPVTSYYEKNFRAVETSEVIGNRTLKAHLSDPEIPSKFKEIFISNGDSLRDDALSLALTDSLFSNDEVRQPFYFVLFTRTMWWADAAFLEPLNFAAKKYAMIHTAMLMESLNGEPTLNDADRNHWTEAVAMEIAISSEGVEQEALEELRYVMMENAEPKQHESVQTFIEKVKAYLP